MISGEDLLVCFLTLLTLASLALSVWMARRLVRLGRVVQQLQRGIENQETVDDTIPTAVGTSEPTILALAGREKTQILLDDILYLRAEAGGVNCYTPEGAVFSWQSLRTCLDKLPPDRFVQVNRSTVVAIAAIAGKTEGGLRLQDGTEIAVSPVFQRDIRKQDD